MVNNLGTLYVVATPIGNLGDISERALEILKEVDMCASEDTRNTLKLFKNKGITTKLISYHDHSSENKISKIIKFLLDGKSIALVSDAGTPSISDPGFSLIRDSIRNDIKVVPIPGASAITTILSVAGVASETFTFYGFPPRKGKKRNKLLMEIEFEEKASIFFESGKRIKNLLGDIKNLNPKRHVVLGRELTKLHEVIYRGDIEEVIKQLVKDSFGEKGEFVLLVEGMKTSTRKDIQLSKQEIKTIDLLLSRLSKNEALSLASEILGLKKNDLYQLLLKRSN